MRLLVVFGSVLLLTQQYVQDKLFIIFADCLVRLARHYYETFYGRSSLISRL